VPVLLLVLKNCCRGSKSSLYKLHLLNWTLPDAERRAALLEALSAERQYQNVRIQVEPSFVQAIQYAVGERLVERLENNRVKITDAGRQFAKEIEAAECLKLESDFFKTLGLKLTEEWVDGFAAWNRAA
jgi:hypothetical protein